MITSPMPSAPEDPDRPLRVLRVLTRPNLGGPTRQAIALWHAHAAQGIETLLVTGAVGYDEVALSPAAHDVPELRRARIAPHLRAQPARHRTRAPLHSPRASYACMHRT